MSDDQTTNEQPSMEDLDSKADTRAIIIVFVTAVLIAVHALSGFTFDF